MVNIQDSPEHTNAQSLSDTIQEANDDPSGHLRHDWMNKVVMVSSKAKQEYNMALKSSF